MCPLGENDDNRPAGASSLEFGIQPTKALAVLGMFQLIDRIGKITKSGLQ
jgi:hypothetical protein